jgi:hypothetical protein
MTRTSISPLLGQPPYASSSESIQIAGQSQSPRGSLARTSTLPYLSFALWRVVRRADVTGLMTVRRASEEAAVQADWLSEGELTGEVVSGVLHDGRVKLPPCVHPSSSASERIGEARRTVQYIRGREGGAESGQRRVDVQLTVPNKSVRVRAGVHLKFTVPGAEKKVKTGNTKSIRALTQIRRGRCLCSTNPRRWCRYRNCPP